MTPVSLIGMVGFLAVFFLGLRKGNPVLVVVGIGGAFASVFLLNDF